MTNLERQIFELLQKKLTKKKQDNRTYLKA